MFINLSKTKATAEVIQLLKSYTSMDFQKDKSVMGFIFESHFLSLSSVTRESLEEFSNLEGISYIFLCCVSKGYQGNAIFEVEEYFRKKKIEIHYVEHLIVGEDLAASDSFAGAKKSKELEEAVKRIASSLEKKEENDFRKKHSSLMAFCAKLLRLPIWYSFLSSSLDSNRCRKCGHCRGVCPTQKAFQK